MTITAYEWRFIAPICIIGAIACLVVGIHFVRVNKNLAAVICTGGAIVISAVLVVVAFVYSNSRQAINCTVTVYDSSGLITEEYSGKLNIKKENADGLSFKDENANFHFISNTEGAIIIERQYKTNNLENPNFYMIKVCNVKGLIIEMYYGYYEIKENKPGCITFEDINGNVLTILYAGTIIIDEQDFYTPTEDAIQLEGVFCCTFYMA